MNKKINALVIDDNETFTSQIKEYFSSHAVINVVKIINNGKDGLEYAINNIHSYDVILMDIIMPEVDGISILEELHKRNIRKNIIVLTSYKKESIIKMISQYDVDYYMIKPINLKTLEQRTIELFSEVSEDDVKDNKIELAISKLLHELGIPSHIRGYQYIRESIYMMYQNPDKIGGITKTIYPEIASRYDTTASRVERAIRHAIEVSWTRGDYDLMEEIFGHSVDYDRSKPTNSEFIATLADNLRLKNKLAIS